MTVRVSESRNGSVASIVGVLSPLFFGFVYSMSIGDGTRAKACPGDCVSDRRSRVANCSNVGLVCGEASKARINNGCIRRISQHVKPTCKKLRHGARRRNRCTLIPKQTQ